MWKLEGNFCELAFFFQAWKQVTLPAEPSHCRPPPPFLSRFSQVPDCPHCIAEDDLELLDPPIISDLVLRLEGRATTPGLGGDARLNLGILEY